MKKMLALGLCCGVTALAVAATTPAGIGSYPQVSTKSKGAASLKVQPTEMAQPQHYQADMTRPGSVREALALYQDLKQAGREIPSWLSSMAFPAQPAGDPARQGGDFASSATAIGSLPYTDSGTTVGYGSEVGNAAPDVFYSLTLGAADVVTVSLCATATSWDSYLRIYQNVGGAVGTQLTSNDDSCGLLSQITAYSLAAGSYFIVVDGYSTSSGAYTINVTGGSISPCTTFTNNLTTITLPYSGTGTNVGAPNALGSGSGDVGYVFTLTESSEVTFSSCVTGTNFDTDSYLYSGNPCAGGTQLLYNDGNSACAASSWASEWVQPCGTMPAGTYTLVLSGYATYSGTYAFNISATSCSCPPITCTGTAEVEPNDGPNGSGAFGTIACGETVCGTTFTVGDSTRDTDWFEVLLLNDGILTVNLDCSAFDGLLFVLGSDAATVVASADNAGFCSDETLTTACLPAGTYYVWVGPNGFTGLNTPVSYGVSVSCQTCTYVSPCQSAVVATCGGSYTGDTTGATSYVGNTAPDHFFRINNTVPGAAYTFSLCGGSTWDTYLRLYDRCPTDAGAVELAYNDDFCSLQSQFDYVMPVGTYYLVVEGYGTAFGAYTLNVTCVTCQPITCTGDVEVEPNGSMTEATPIVCGQTYCGQTNTFNDGVNDNRDTDWYEVVLTSDATLSAALDVESFNGLLLVTDAMGITVASADAAGFCADEVLTTSCLQAGTYYVFVAHNAFTGVDVATNYGLTLSCQGCTWVDPYTTCQATAGTADAWTAGTSEVDTGAGAGYTRAERFSGVAGAISAIDFRGLPLYNDGVSWAACTEDPAAFTITFYDMALAQTAQYTTTLTGVAGDLYASVYPSMDYHFDLPAPLYQSNGYVSIVGAGSTSCWFLWMNSATGVDSASLLNEGTGWVAAAFDLNYCFTTVQPCDPVLDLDVSMASGNATLSWTATTGATRYDVYGSTDGYGTYTLLGNSTTTSFVDAGAQSAGRKFYRVVTVCQ